MEQNICKYLVFFIVTVQCECVNVNLRSSCLLFIELQDALQAEPGSH